MGLLLFTVLVAGGSSEVAAVAVERVVWFRVFRLRAQPAGHSSRWYQWYGVMCERRRTVWLAWHRLERHSVQLVTVWLGLLSHTHNTHTRAGWRGPVATG